MAEVSIIVTAYNIERYIEQCLDSVAAQTLSDIEVLVVDDGSSDTTPQKIVEFCDGDQRFIPVLLPENSPGGVATAANAGLDRATARWVGFVDGDDYVEPTMFERLVNAAAACDADLAMCEYQEVVDGSGERRDPADAHRWAELTASCYKLDVHTRRQVLRFIAVPWRKLYRRSLLEDNAIRFPVSDGFYEDNPFHWFSVISARSIAVVPEVLCYHRVGRTGQTMATADERLFQIFTHHDTIHTWLAAKGLLDVYQSQPARMGDLADGMDRQAHPAAVATQVVRHLGADLRGVLADGDRDRAARGKQGGDCAAAERCGGQARVRQLRTHARPAGPPRTTQSSLPPST